MTPSIRKARVQDAGTIHKLLGMYASEGKLLPRSLWDIYSHLQEFFVWEGDSGEVQGICALHITWEDLAELRSLSVAEAHMGKGIGKALSDAVFKAATDIGVNKLFVLTYIPSYFEKLGFRRVEKSDLPHKVWADCIHCVKFPECDEIALILDIDNT